MSCYQGDCNGRGETRSESDSDKYWIAATHRQTHPHKHPHTHPERHRALEFVRNILQQTKHAKTKDGHEAIGGAAHEFCELFESLLHAMVLIGGEKATNQSRAKERMATPPVCNDLRRMQRSRWAPMNR
jgi:hypothetical protein